MLPLSSLNSRIKNNSIDLSAKASCQFESIHNGQFKDINGNRNTSSGYKSTLVYLVLMSFMTQFLVTPVFSAGTLKGSATPREYTYTRYSPVTDDSWIGTPKKNTNNGTLGSKDGNATTSSKIAGGIQISDGSWILSKKNTNNGTLGSKDGNATNGNGNNGNIILNSAPSNPKTENTTQITYIPVSTTIPAGYTTPNGTLITNLPSSYVAPVTISSSIGLSSFSALGALTYNNISGVFGIAIANSTTTGALSMNDWIEFNNKENILAFNN